MALGSVFENNRTQAVRLPVETRFPEGVKKVIVRVVGLDRIISPINNAWNNFFLSKEGVSVEKSSMPEQNLFKVEDFVSRLEVLAYGAKAASHYGEIRADLERKGTPIGVNDLHIAGHARSEGLTLVSNNVREFARVESLRLVNWV